jgi:hypothetical protein
MRLLISAVTAVLATMIVASTADAASTRHHRATPSGQVARPSGGYSARPWWQGTPSDRLPIWRNGYYQGNDPDPFIRSQMMRDPLVGPWP